MFDSGGGKSRSTDPNRKVCLQTILLFIWINKK